MFFVGSAQMIWGRAEMIWGCLALRSSTTKNRSRSFSREVSACCIEGGVSDVSCLPRGCLHTHAQTRVAPTDTRYSSVLRPDAPKSCFSLQWLRLLIGISHPICFAWSLAHELLPGSTSQQEEEQSTQIDHNRRRAVRLISPYF